MIEYFKEGITPRDEQTYIINEIEENLDNYDCFVINAPTGVGKSHIAYVISNYFESVSVRSAIITSTISLQDQYHKDFPEIPVVKGMNNFACVSLLETNDLSIKEQYTVGQLRDDHLTCSSGECVKEIEDENGIITKESCKHLGLQDDQYDESYHESYKHENLHSRDCLYYVQRDEGLGSPRVLLNYSSLFTYLKYRVKGAGRYCMIYDEAHNIEDQLVNYIGHSYRHVKLEEMGIDIDVTKLDDDREGTMKLLLQVIEKCNKRRKQIKNRNKNARAQREYLELEVKKAENLLDEIEENPDGFLFYNQESENFMTFKIMPNKVHDIARRYLVGNKMFFLSATVTKDSINKDLGIEKDRIYEIQTMKHSFPLENREIKYLNIAKITHDNFKKNTDLEKKCILQIQEIARKYPDQRGLVLITRKTDLQLMKDLFDKDVVERLIEGHSTNEDGTIMQEVIENLNKNSNGILVSASAWEGIDLNDDLARWYVIYKMPWGDLTDMRINKMKDLDSEWYERKCITKLIQGFGRCIRSKEDYATGYCIDIGIKTGLWNYMHLVPKAYKDMFEF